MCGRNIVLFVLHPTPCPCPGREQREIQRQSLETNFGRPPSSDSYLSMAKRVLLLLVSCAAQAIVLRNDLQHRMHVSCSATKNRGFQQRGPPTLHWAWFGTAHP